MKVALILPFYLNKMMKLSFAATWSVIAHHTIELTNITLRIAVDRLSMAFIHVCNPIKHAKAWHKYSTL